MIARSAAKDADTVAGYVAAFENAGCDELILFPCFADSVQVELLAAACGVRTQPWQRPRPRIRAPGRCKVLCAPARAKQRSPPRTREPAIFA